MRQRQTSDIKAADTDRIGFFGKLPSHGDFVSSGVGLALQHELDHWLQSGLRAGEERLGSRWHGTFHAMPPWRFIVERGLWGPATIAGVLLPSKDRVGRSFPLVIAAQLYAFDDHPRQLYLDAAWFTAAEALGESSLARDFDIGTFTAGLKRLRLPHAERSAIAGRFAARQRESTTLWWRTDATSAQVKGFRTVSAPGLSHFLRLIDSGDAAPRPEVHAGETPRPDNGAAILEEEAVPLSGALTAARTPTPQRLNPVVAHSHATHVGTRLSLNADALVVSDAARLYAVADGIGDGPAATEAARLTAAALGELRGHDLIEEIISGIKGKLGRAHSLLNSIASSSQRDAPAASVVVLSIKDNAFAVVWAGDARCYLLREGLMRCLTRDHVEIGMKRRLTRFLGAERQLVPETHTGLLCDGDRFLLCSCSLIRVLGERAVAEVLIDAEGGRAAETLVQDGLICNSPDNLSALVVDVSLP